MHELTQAARPKAREHWMDFLRGVAIIAVVFEHAVHHAEDKADAVPWLLHFATDVLNPIRMPLLVFLSGMLLQASLSKGRAAYVAGKLRNILYPFLVWSAFYIALWMALDRILATPHSWWEIAWIPVDPPAHMWFLRDLFVFYLVMLVVRDVPAWLLVAGSLALSGVAGLLTDAVENDAPMQRFLFLFAFFVLGDLAARHAGSVWALLEKAWAAVLAAALAAALVPLALLLGNTRFELVSLPFAIGTIGAMMLLARVGARSDLAGAVRFLGRNSLVIYVLHWLAVTAVSVLLARLMDIGGGWLVLFNLALTLALTAVAAGATERLRMAWLFRLPRGWPAAGRLRSLAAR